MTLRQRRSNMYSRLTEREHYIPGIHREDPGKAAKVRVTFEDDTRRDYILNDAGLAGDLVASYGLKGQEFRYQFRNYAAAFDESVISDLTAAVSAYDYQTDIAGITPEEESRLYADYYSGSVQEKQNAF